MCLTCELQITPFNMKEELEEGHFDGDGHFQWKKQTEIKDHWLDNLDWVKIQKLDNERKQKAAESGEQLEQSTSGGLGDSSSESEDEENAEKQKSLKNFDVIAAYRRILELMKPRESIKRTLQRLGQSSAKISSIERFRRKKAGIVDENAKFVTELTELTNNILTKMGNMNVYEETFEEISAKFASKMKGASLDMYSDDFDANVQKKTTDESKNDGNALASASASASTSASVSQPTTALGVDDSIITWEFKWKMDDANIQGPYTTDQMYKWSQEGYFKDGVFVKKCGSDSQQFNSSNRIDFELYL